MYTHKNFLLLALTLISCESFANDATHSVNPTKASDTLEEVEVVEISPLDGLNLTKDKVPTPVQTATDKDINKTNAINISDFMNRSLGSVYVNDVQGNGFQPDINYRGFTASPLAGTSQGLSVYMDGVRLNQPFGDVVSWDLIPKSAIKSMAMMPGSNPLFGRNTLGGALSLETKDGISNQGTSVQGIGGEYGRNAYEFEHGGKNDHLGLNWFFTGNYFQDHGWRDNSPSNVRQIFGKVGWQGEKSELKLTTAFSDNSLYGNGIQDFQLLKQNYTSIYTKPDITENRSIFINLEGLYQVNNRLQLTGNTYYRNIKTNSFNGDINEDTIEHWAQNGPYQSDVCRYQDSELCNGLINTGLTQQQNWGTQGQAILSDKLFGLDNQMLFGLGYDQSVMAFNQSSQFANMLPDRGMAGVAALNDESSVALSGDTITWSFFTQDTLSITQNLHLTASGRYNFTSVSNKDALIASGPESLSGKSNFDRFNPSVGLTYNPLKEIGYYANYSEATRAPTSIETGCANPLVPCRLPNAMAGDPPLKQVISENWETGFRGELPGHVNWNLGYFRIENANDLQFVVSPSQSSMGYFKNFGKTRRQGIEFGLDRKIEKWNYGFNYTWLEATFQSSEQLLGESNSSAVDGVISIRPGNRIPLVPQHTFKTFVDYQMTPEWGANMNVIGFSSMFTRGNENNAHQADGESYLGSGKISGYVVLNYGLRYQPSYVKGLQIFGQVNNLLDEKFMTSGQLGPHAIGLNGSFAPQNDVHTTFYGPGAPRTWWLGMRYSF